MRALCHALDARRAGSPIDLVVPRIAVENYLSLGVTPIQGDEERLSACVHACGAIVGSGLVERIEVIAQGLGVSEDE
jgi:hypothetical protein